MVGIKDIKFRQVRRGDPAGQGATLFVTDSDLEKLAEVAYIPIGKGAPKTPASFRRLGAIYDGLRVLELFRVISDETMHYALYKLGITEEFDNAFAVLYTWFDFLVVEDLFLTEVIGEARLSHMNRILAGYPIVGGRKSQDRFRSYYEDLVAEYNARGSAEPSTYRT
jgi:hypothetical protein